VVTEHQAEIRNRAFMKGNSEKELNRKMLIRM